MLQSTDSIEDIHFVVNSAPLILQRVAYGVELLKVNISAVCWSQWLVVKLVFRQLTLGRAVMCFLLDFKKILCCKILQLLRLILLHARAH